MTMDLSQLFDDKPKTAKFDILKVYHKESGEVRLIKSTRFDSRYHSMNIPRNAVEKLDFNHPAGTIDLSTKAPEAPDIAPDVKVDTTTDSPIPTPIIKDNEVGATNEFVCSKGCGKVCTSNAGKASHERACKVQVDKMNIAGIEFTASSLNK